MTEFQLSCKVSPKTFFIGTNQTRIPTKLVRRNASARTNEPESPDGNVGNSESARQNGIACKCVSNSRAWDGERIKPHVIQGTAQTFAFFSNDLMQGGRGSHYIDRRVRKSRSERYKSNIEGAPFPRRNYERFPSTDEVDIRAKAAMLKRRNFPNLESGSGSQKSASKANPKDNVPTDPQRCAVFFLSEFVFTNPVLKKCSISFFCLIKSQKYCKIASAI